MGLLTTAYDTMREIASVLRQAPDKSISTVPVIIGGCQLNTQVCEYVGADYLIDSAMIGVRMCQEIMSHI